MGTGIQQAEFTQPASALPSDLPVFPVFLEPPDLGRFEAGNTGVAGFTTRDSGQPGPHVLIVSLVHGNEIAGAIAIKELLEQDFCPACGRLTLGFANLDAYRSFDPTSPLTSRFVEEDLNRVWDDAQLFGVRRSNELDRAREIRRLADTADLVLDLHSMLWPSAPLLLCGPSPRGRALAAAVAEPALIIADHGHAGGKRLIDYGRFTAGSGSAAAILVEAGQHWEPATLQQSRATIAALLRHAGMLPQTSPAAAPTSPTFAEVTRVITARTNRFVFTRDYVGGEVIGAAGTLIAHDGEQEIRTPHDDCLLVMPSLRTARGHTALRMARFTYTNGPKD